MHVPSVLCPTGGPVVVRRCTTHAALIGRALAPVRTVDGLVDALLPWPTTGPTFLCERVTMHLPADYANDAMGHALTPPPSCHPCGSP